MVTINRYGCHNCLLYSTVQIYWLTCVFFIVFYSDYYLHLQRSECNWNLRTVLIVYIVFFATYKSAIACVCKGIIGCINRLERNNKLVCGNYWLHLVNCSRPAVSYVSIVRQLTRRCSRQRVWFGPFPTRRWITIINEKTDRRKLKTCFVGTTPRCCLPPVLRNCR